MWWVVVVVVDGGQAKLIGRISSSSSAAKGTPNTPFAKLRALLTTAACPPPPLRRLLPWLQPVAGHSLSPPPLQPAIVLCGQGDLGRCFLCCFSAKTSHLPATPPPPTPPTTLPSQSLVRRQLARFAAAPQDMPAPAHSLSSTRAVLSP